ncbi:MFS transporter [Haliscomenobacter sp.]|uniref:MFS transporter n=1 Tax=Haliscomenobacter sp. TaxID=2717303 RepID=UPI003BA964B6
MSATSANMRLAIIASATGTLLEWYDLFLAVILAKTLSSQLFPSGESTYFLETLAIVGSSFFIRPLGSLFFGSMGDRKGRKQTFLLSLLVMGGATFLIGLIPTYQQAGWLAPLSLLVLRLAQGFALSGEYSGAIIYVSENAPADKRGFYTGFIQATVPVGLLLCLLVVIGTQSLMSPESFNAWGWRLPFLSSAVLVFFSYIVRRRMEETPVFSQLKDSGNVSKSPIRESLNSFPKWRLILMLIFGGNAAQSSIMQTSQFVTLYFLQRAVKIEEQLSFIILATALLLGTPFFQWAGALSDRIGRKKVIYAGILLGMISIPLSFYLFNTLGNPGHLTEPHSISIGLTLLFILLCFVNMLSSALVYGPMGVFMTEFFEGRTRYTSMGFAHNIGNGVIGGATPLVTEFLKANLVVGALLAPYIGLLYPLGLVVLALIINPFLKETVGKN